MKTFRDRLLLVVQHSGMAASAFGKAAGLGQSYVSQVKRGEIVSPSVDAVKKLAKFGRVDETWLGSGGGEPPAWLRVVPEVDLDEAPERKQIIAMARKLAPGVADDVIDAAIEAFRVQPFKDGNPGWDGLVSAFRECVRRAKDLKRGMLDDLERDRTEAEREAFD